MSLEYSGIEIRQFTHSAEIKREIPFCTRKRSETYVFTRFCHSVHGGVSRPIPREEVEGSGRGGSPGPYPGGRLRGLARGVSRPIPRGVQAQGGCIPACTEADPHRATAADGTHPTGMDSCSAFNLQFEAMRKEFLT